MALRLHSDSSEKRSRMMDIADAQRIVIVTEDDSVRDAMELLVMLGGIGPSVRTTACGGEALGWLDAEPCDLLILDFILPDMTGPMLYRRLLACWPSACPPVLFVSDDTDVTGYE